MATSTKPQRKNIPWWQTLIQIQLTLLPTILGAIFSPDPDKEPATIFVQSHEGVGNASAATYPPVSLSEAMEKSREKK